MPGKGKKKGNPGKAVPERALAEGVAERWRDATPLLVEMAPHDTSIAYGAWCFFASGLGGLREKLYTWRSWYQSVTRIWPLDTWI